MYPSQGFVASDTLIPAGETDVIAIPLQGGPAPAFTFSSLATAHPSLTILGSVDVRAFGFTTAISDFSPASQFTVGASGTFSLSNTSGGAIGYDNLGFDVSGPISSTIENDGQVTVQGRDYATGFVLYWGESLTNTGTIQVSSTSSAPTESTTGVSDFNGGVINNSGTISVSATDGPGASRAIGVLLGSNLGSSTLINSGSILVGGTTLSGGQPPAAIETFGVRSNIITIVNSGVISASGARAIDSASGGDGVIHLTNATGGSIVGDILMGIGTGGQIRNAGSIHGDVHLDMGDLYDGRGGTLTGVLYLGAGTDTVFLGAEGEKVQGGAGSAIILGGAGIDHILGGAGDDIIDGGGNGGGDTPNGFAGGDVLDGGGGINTASFASEPGSVAVTLREQNGFQDVGVNHWVSLSNFQNLTGSAFADLLTGDAHDNVIDGGGGGDFLTGGAGADTFVVRRGGAEEVTDFSAAQGDRISLAAVANVHTLAQFQALISAVGSDTVIDLGHGSTVKLDGVTPDALTAADLTFSVAPGDFLGTGHASLFWQNAVNNLTSAWLLTDAAPASGVSLPAVAGWQTYDVGNFSGGAYGGDFLLRNTTTGMVNIWQDNAGTMSGHDVDKATLDWQIMGAVDFNADGKSDILWRNEENGYVSVWQMDGSTVSTTYNPGVVGLQWKLVGANDFYGDGKAEVLWRDSGSGEVNLWTIDGPGAGQTHGQTVAYLGNEWNVAGTGDFNGDGKADILWFDTVTGQVVVWEMNGASVLAHQEIGDPGPQWRVVDVADISGDGKADILWRDTGTGQVVAWAMDGFHVDHYGVLATVDNTWKVINHHYDLA